MSVIDQNLRVQASDGNGDCQKTGGINVPPWTKSQRSDSVRDPLGSVGLGLHLRLITQEFVA